jgi:hypothetical protein
MGTNRDGLTEFLTQHLISKKITAGPDAELYLSDIALAWL